jgi:halimadienyl-diphosphate synthase
VVAALVRARRSELIPAPRLALAAKHLLSSLAEGTTSETAYDTAVVSSLRASGDRRQLAFPTSLGWLRQHQHPDGSWGGRIQSAHDRLISTLAAVVRLAEIAEAWAQRAVQRGVAYLWQHASDWRASAHETVAFELLMPGLVAQGAEQGLALPFAAFAPITRLRDEKLRRIPDGYLYEKPTTLVHSLEFLGLDLDRARVTRLRSANGSYGNSPSATAYVVEHANDAAAEGYLHRAMAAALNGGATTVYPNEVFEKAWVLYNLGPARFGVAGAQDHLSYLREHLRDGAIGISREGLTADSDDTGMVLSLLHRAGEAASLAGLRQFEQPGYFSCFPYERNTSVSANIHVLDAFVSSPLRSLHETAIAKILSYLRDQRQDGCYWQDKWHISPYYATSQLVLAAHEIAGDLLAPTYRWLLDTQRPDGSWGLAEGTSEETAYAVQALLTLAARPEKALRGALDRGARYLADRFDDADYPELWIGKGLYTPYPVVRAAVIGALQQYQTAARAR